MKQWLTVLRDARKRRGISVIKLAAELGVTRAAVHRWEEGERVPDLEMMQRWGSAVGVRVELVVDDLPMMAAEPESPAYNLIARLTRAADTIDEQTIRLLMAQLDVLAPERPG